MKRLLLLPCLLALAACAGQAVTSARVATTTEPTASARSETGTQTDTDARAETGARQSAPAQVVPATPAAEATTAARSWELRAADWARPRSGSALVGMAPLPQVVRAWSAAGDRDIVILHAGGEEGELWARELRDWLVALGVPAERIRRAVGGPGPHGLQLELRALEVVQ